MIMTFQPIDHLMVMAFQPIDYSHCQCHSGNIKMVVRPKMVTAHLSYGYSTWKNHIR